MVNFLLTVAAHVVGGLVLDFVHKFYDLNQKQ